MSCKKLILAALIIACLFTAACSGANTHSVTFNLNGAAGTAPKTQTVENGGKARETLTPVAEGKIFSGWYTDSACAETARWDFKVNTVTKDITLFAKWIDAPVTGDGFTVTDDGGERTLSTGGLKAGGLSYGNEVTFTDGKVTAVSVAIDYADAAYSLPYYIPADAGYYEEIKIGANNYVIKGDGGRIDKSALGNRVGLKLINPQNAAQSIVYFVNAAVALAKTDKTVAYAHQWVTGYSVEYTFKFAENITVSGAPVRLGATYYTGYNEESLTTGLFVDSAKNYCCEPVKLGIKVNNNLTDAAGEDEEAYAALFGKNAAVQISDFNDAAVINPFAVYIESSDRVNYYSKGLSDKTIDDVFISSRTVSGCFAAGGSNSFFRAGITLLGDESTTGIHFEKTVARIEVSLSFDFYAVAPAADEESLPMLLYFGSLSYSFIILPA